MILNNVLAHNSIAVFFSAFFRLADFLYDRFVLKNGLNRQRPEDFKSS